MSATARVYASGSRTRRGAANAFLAAFALALGLFRGAELCFCVHEVSAERGHLHCLPCDPCGEAAIRAPAAAGAALSAGAEACDHLGLGEPELYFAVQAGVACSVDCEAAPTAFAVAVAATGATAVLPPSTAPPEGGDTFLSYRDRVFLRS